MVEQQPSKLMTRVRFPSPALEAVSKKDERRQTKFELTAGSLRLDPAAVAQLVERVLGKDEVISSSLISSFVRRGGTVLLAERDLKIANQRLTLFMTPYCCQSGINNG